MGILAAMWSPLDVLAARKPEKMRPQPGDHLVFAFGDRAGQLIQSEDIKLGAAPVEAYPKLVAQIGSESVLRDRSRLNMVLVIRLLPERLSRATRENTAEGVVAYSAVCTHTGCTVEGWDADYKHLICPCHHSRYDATNSANVLSGPAPKPLAMLPLRIEAGKILVARKFTRKVGFKINKY
jgi:Rieske Fe-S protein